LYSKEEDGKECVWLHNSVWAQGPRAHPSFPQDVEGKLKNATAKNKETAAEWRRYHARTPQHSDVLDAQ